MNEQSKITLGSMFDAHAHLTFASHPEQFAAWIAEHLAGAFSTTVTPEDFARGRNAFGSQDAIKIGIGAHPWWISQKKLSLDALEQTLPEFSSTRFVGEIGLDFGKGGMRDQRFNTEAAAKKAQIDALRMILAACRVAPDGAISDEAAKRVFSFHAVQSADVIMDLLEEYDLIANNAVIFHWFSGSSVQLQRARELGCSFSINSFMLNTKRGREYARAIPADRLLVETDLPEEPENREGSRAAAPAAASSTNASDTEELYTENPLIDRNGTPPVGHEQQRYQRALVSAYEQILGSRGERAIEQIGRNASRIFGLDD